MTSKKSNIRSALARFEETITKNNEAGVESKMFLSNVSKNPAPGDRPKKLAGVGSKRLISSSRLRPVSESGSTGTATTMDSAHSRVISSIGEDWGTFEKPNDDPWRDNDEDESFGADVFGDFGGADDDDWQSVTSNTQSVTNSLNESMSSFQPENDKPRTSTSGGRSRPSSSRPKGTSSSSSSTSKTFMLTGGGPSPPPRRKTSSRPEGSSSSRPEGSSSSRPESSRLGGSTHTSRSGSSRPKESEEIPRASTSGRSTKAPLRSFRGKPSGDGDEGSESPTSTVGRSSASRKVSS
jgi:hypothetical protein